MKKETEPLSTILVRRLFQRKITLLKKEFLNRGSTKTSRSISIKIYITRVLHIDDHDDNKSLLNKITFHLNKNQILRESGTWGAWIYSRTWSMDILGVHRSAHQRHFFTNPLIRSYFYLNLDPQFLNQSQSRIRL